MLEDQSHANIITGTSLREQDSEGLKAVAINENTLNVSIPTTAPRSSQSTPQAASRLAPEACASNVSTAITLSRRPTVCPNQLLQAYLPKLIL
jgi:hypothetical protein